MPKALISDKRAMGTQQLGIEFKTVFLAYGAKTVFQPWNIPFKATIASRLFETVYLKHFVELIPEVIPLCLLNVEEKQRQRMFLPQSKIKGILEHLVSKSTVEDYGFEHRKKLIGYSCVAMLFLNNEARRLSPQSWRHYG